MSDPNQAPNPLQLGEVLYETLEATVIATPDNSASLQYTRIGFNATQTEVLDHGNLSSSSVLDGSSFPDLLTGTMPVFLLAAESVTMIGAAGPTAADTWSLDVQNCTGLIGLDPTQPATRTLLLLGADETSPFMAQLVCMPGGKASSSTTSVISLGGVSGTPQMGLLIRQQMSARVIVASVSGTHLLVYDLGSASLGTNPTSPAEYPVIDLGPTAGGSIDMTAVSLFAGPDQQIAVTFVDANQAINVSVLGWNGNKLTKLAAWSSSTNPQPQTGPSVNELSASTTTVRIVAADLAASGTDQIVVGFAASYKGTDGCAALLLFTQSGTPQQPVLTFQSAYAAATADKPHQPIASIDLHLAAGLFSQPGGSDVTTPGGQGVLGVLIIGCGASLSQLVNGTAAVMAGLVQVASTTFTFPPLGDGPGVPAYLSTILTVGAATQFITAFPSDVTGQSVILGPPSLSQTSEQKGQLLAIMQAPPFEKNNSSNAPTLQITRAATQSNGYNVTSNKTWTFSHDTALNIGISKLTLGQTLNSSYGNGFSNTADATNTTDLSVLSTITNNDLIFLYAMSYDVWEYPVFRKSSQNAPDGVLAVIFPQTPQPTQTIIPASDPSIGYKPLSQSGMLLSYVDLTDPPGYDDSNLLFELVSFPVTDDTSGTTVTYTDTQMNTNTTGVDFNVQNSASSNAQFSFDTALFDYVPLNFGLNITDGSSFSDSTVKTTSVSHTSMFSVAVSSGAVPDIEYTYQVVPYIYQHKSMGCLIVTYTVTLDGPGWPDYYAKNVMPVCLISVSPNTEQPVLAAFSRDISFADQPDGSVNVTVSLFNNSLTVAGEITCDLYIGQPVLNGQTLTPPTDVPIATQGLATLNGGARGTLTFNARLESPSQVTVRVYTSGQESLAVIYWAAYPPASLMTLTGT